MKARLFLLILLSFFCLFSISAQKNNKKITITGTVMDASKAPIVNAILMTDGQKTNVVTDSEGKYKIKVKPTVARIGFFTFGNGIIEENIEGRTTINVTFGTISSQVQAEQGVAPGDEGVNVGYNSIKKKNLTTDINKIDGTNEKYASYSTIYDMIQREVSGVRVNGTNIVIQDSKNLWGSIPPLFIVDGVPVQSISDIQPSSVSSIEVLKGSSAAMYGSRGYGGVILIKTKLQNN